MASSNEIRSSLRRQAAAATARALGRDLLKLVVTLVVVTALWQLALWAFGVNTYIGKGPADIWAYLVTDADAGENRAVLFDRLWVSLGHAVIGFVAGLVVALVAAMLFQLNRGVEHALMPLAMLLRSVPLVAMAPVITLIFGRDLWSVAVIGGIVVLFPALVNIVFGLRSASPQMLDLVAVYGGSAFTALRKVALPSSLPAFFAAVRISVPGALTGALLAEWLATSDGIGGGIGPAISQSRFPEVWASIVLVTAAALILYNLIQAIEDVVLTRLGMHPLKNL
ncbi:ABC transporter permease subunit [Microbacterium sp. MEC084]|jgi:ABC-type nitrate/sulfonate/bicarbonate transport system permease component|uniref:ABC transporter permease n=1 Tax=unclassified Microbacterium TaxID=2609290 RepID=UPI0006FE1C61|nr:MULTISPECIES: ABC transporter permease subunit [unclassified Microbacterium]KQZ11951.1 ABC transporter permease [Microbacterium sp. Root53]MCD1267881.1 ABC transporter permease subunit [Microbacterium sp. MEC084]